MGALSNKRKDTLNIVLMVALFPLRVYYIEFKLYMTFPPLPYTTAPNVTHSESGMNKTIKLYSFHS